MQHAIFSVPNWDEGYCVDDNARALILTIQLEPTSLFDSHLKLLQSRYFAFVINAFDPKIGKFRNFMNLQREWLEVSGSEDSQGRSMWALGTAASRIGNPHNAALAAKIFELAILSLMEMQSPRTWAYAILGTTAYLEKYIKSTSALRLLECSAHKLDQLFELNALPGWLWPEARIAYANARLPQALITAGSFLENQRMRNRGLDSLEWLLERQVSSNMNALVGQEAKVNRPLFRLLWDEGADDGGGKDGGDFASTGAGRHLCWRCKFEVLHDGLRGIATVMDSEPDLPKRMAIPGNRRQNFRVN